MLRYEPYGVPALIDPDIGFVVILLDGLPGVHLESLPLCAHAALQLYFLLDPLLQRLEEDLQVILGEIRVVCLNEVSQEVEVGVQIEL
jgi:hypothetical protein